MSIYFFAIMQNIIKKLKQKYNLQNKINNLRIHNKINNLKIHYEINNLKIYLQNEIYELKIN